MKNNRKQIIIGNNTPNAYSLSLSLGNQQTQRPIRRKQSMDNQYSCRKAGDARSHRRSTSHNTQIVKLKRDRERDTRKRPT